jgi:hypothetical protein
MNETARFWNPILFSLLKKSVLFWLFDGKMRKDEKFGFCGVKVFHYGFVITPERETTLH